MRALAASALLGFAFSAALVQAADPTSTDALETCRLERGAQRAVARVIDGETLLLDDGSQLRLIGALAPRASDVGADPGKWPPEEATVAVLRDLVTGRSLQLWLDRERTDRYGQLLAHAVATAPGAPVWIQRALIERGLARVYATPGADACTVPLLRLEQEAREQKRGLWANAAYALRAAGDGSDLVRHAGTFQIITGTVRSVSGRGSIYLALEPRGRPGQPYGFSALITKGRAALPDERAPRSLKGQRVRVRGWIEQRRGPLIAIDSAGQLELLE